MLVGVFLGARDIPPRDSLIRAPERRSLAKKKKKSFVQTLANTPGTMAESNAIREKNILFYYFFFI